MTECSAHMSSESGVGRCVHASTLRREEWAERYLLHGPTDLRAEWLKRLKRRWGGVLDGPTFDPLPAVLFISFHPFILPSAGFRFLSVSCDVLSLLLSLSLSLSLSPSLFLSCLLSSSPPISRPPFFVFLSSPAPSTLLSSGLLVWQLFLHINPWNIRNDLTWHRPGVNHP